MTQGPVSRAAKKIARVYENNAWRLIKKSFPFWQRLGFHLTPNHFYYPIPDTAALKDDFWLRRSELTGIDINERAQLNLLSQFVADFREEYEAFPREKTPTPYQYYVNNDAFGSVDGEILYCMIRSFKPARFFEIGSGNSTYLAAQAILENTRESGRECTLIACEPYPNKVLKAGFPGLTSLRQTAVQNIPLPEFKELKANDILFIDSSHVLKIASDVQYELLDILPSLNKGVIIHFHDIFLPAEYLKEWVLERLFFWNEQYLLQAFLSFNDSFEVLWAGSYMHLKYPEKLESAFNSYRRGVTWPVSFWIRKIK